MNWFDEIRLFRASRNIQYPEKVSCHTGMNMYIVFHFNDGDFFDLLHNQCPSNPQNFEGHFDGHMAKFQKRKKHIFSFFQTRGHFKNNFKYFRTLSGPKFHH